LAGPIARKYKAGSIVYFENDTDVNEIYVLHSGRVILIHTNIVTGLEEKEEVQRGEFFGVKSALGRYRREETAQIIGNTVVLVFTVKEFEALSMRNIPLTLKMLRVFSTQLRNIGRQVREVLGQTEMRMPSTELLNVADYFFKNLQIDQSIYAYERYLFHYPQGKYVDRAKEMLTRCRKGMNYPDNAQPLDEDLLSDQPDEQLTAPVKPGGEGLHIGEKSEESLKQILYNGITEYGAGNFDVAISIYQKILSRTQLKNQEELLAYEQAQYEFGRALIGKGDFQKALDVFQIFLKKFQNSEYVKSVLFNMAFVYEKIGQMQKAVSFYRKVIIIPPNDGDSAKAKERIKKLAG
jgi:tetratricopeptide (TPR) repeat protein